MSVRRRWPQGVHVSAPTILRLLRASPDPVWDTPVHIVGVDDWALRKGHTYATVMVDLDHHRIVDVLPDRQSETVAQWLADHPGITVVTRDRARGYGNAIAARAPEAQQVADRWHLLKNLGEAVEELFACSRAAHPLQGPRRRRRPPREGWFTSKNAGPRFKPWRMRATASPRLRAAPVTIAKR